MKHLFRALAGLALAAGLLGCGTLPDAQPFADATNALSSSVKTSGQAVSDSLRDTGGIVPLAESAFYEKKAQELDTAWKDRVKATQGAVAYSMALADLVAAGKSGADTAKKLSDNVGALATAAGIPIAAPLADTLGDIARFLLERIAIIRSSEKLEDAVQQAQPAIDKIAAHLAVESAEQLKPLLDAAYKNSISGIKSKYDADSNFSAKLSEQRDKIRESVLKDQKKVSELQEFDQLQESLDARLRERDKKIDVASQAFKTRLALVNALGASAGTWAAAHRDLANAIREKRKVTVTELQDTVTEIRDLIKKVRAI